MASLIMMRQLWKHVALIKHKQILLNLRLFRKTRDNIHKPWGCKAFEDSVEIEMSLGKYETIIWNQIIWESKVSPVEFEAAPKKI